MLALATLLAARPVVAVDLGQLLGYGGNDPTLETFKLIHVGDLKSLMADNKAGVHIYDANDASVRAKFGTIPGATLLPSDDQYDLAMLPQDKHAKLVFYCTNSMCTASHDAARRAVKGGYEDVSVMADGIMGWKKAGEATSSSTTTEGRPTS
jgi:rhodanese-related sulfurtransferase